MEDPHIPRFPIIISNPTHKDIQNNIRRRDYVQALFVSIISLPIGYFVGRHIERYAARRTMLLSGIIGSIGGVCMAYQNASLRLQGFAENSEEVERYGQEQNDVISQSGVADC